MKRSLPLLLALVGCTQPSAPQGNIVADVAANDAAPVATATPSPATVAAEPAPAAVDQSLQAAHGLPNDVQQFIAAYEECEHWAGEEPYDADRRQEIEAGVNASCTGIDARLARLNRKYAADAAVSAKLADYAPVHM